MNPSLYLPGDELIDEALAVWLGYFWCRYAKGQVVGDRYVRFLMSAEQFEDAKIRFGEGSIVPAKGDEPVEQLAFRGLPPYHNDLNAMAQVEHKIHEQKLWDLYITQLRNVAGVPIFGLLSAEHTFLLIAAKARTKAQAAFLLLEAIRPKT